jgi:hypothetical protein
MPGERAPFSRDTDPGLPRAGEGCVRPGTTGLPGLRETPGRETTLQQPGQPARGGASVLLLLLGLFPAEVLACPSCTVRAPESSVRSGLLLGALVLMPFVLVGVGIWAARRAAREARP